MLCTLFFTGCFTGPSDEFETLADFNSKSFCGQGFVVEVSGFADHKFSNELQLDVLNVDAISFEDDVLYFRSSVSSDIGYLDMSEKPYVVNFFKDELDELEVEQCWGY